jgi:hypothetical protein
METNKEELVEEVQEERVIEYADLLKYTDEDFYQNIFEEFLSVPYENFVRRSDEEIKQLVNKENVLDLVDLVANLGQLHQTPMIRISKAIAEIIVNLKNDSITEPQAKAVARHYYQDKKRRTGSKIEMVFEERDEDSPEFNFGEYLRGSDEDDKEVEVINVYIDNILEATVNKQSAVFEILNTINHEFFHAIEAKKRTKENIYDHHTLQGALDNVIIGSDMLYHNKDYYTSNYSDIVEERRAEIYGITRTLDILKQYPTDQYNQYIKQGERKIVQLEMQKNVKLNYEPEIVKSRFEVANQMASELIKNDPEILKENKILNHIHHKDGSRKTVSELISDKKTAENEVFKKLIEIETLIEQGSRKKYEKRYRETKYNYNKIYLYYSELIYYAFKTMEYDEFKELFNIDEAIQQLESSLKLVLKSRQTRLLENNRMYMHSLLKVSTWKRQLENLKRHVEKSKRAIDKFNHYNDRVLREKTQKKM